MGMNVTIYRHKDVDGLYCAIPQGRSRPPFVRDRAWTFAGMSTPDRPRPDGFEESAALAASQSQGFYAFRSRPRLDRRMYLGR